jgi:hypothetical protein
MTSDEWKTASSDEKLEILRNDLRRIANAQRNLSYMMANLLGVLIKSKGVSEDIVRDLTSASPQTNRQESREAGSSDGHTAGGNDC